MPDYVDLHRGVPDKTTRLSVVSVDEEDQVTDYHLAKLNDQDRRHLWKLLVREATRVETDEAHSIRLTVWVQYAQLVMLLLTVLGILVVLVTHH